LHLELREPDIHAIKVSGEIAKEEKRNQSPDDLAEDVVFSGDVRGQSDGRCGDTTHAVFPPIVRGPSRQTPTFKDRASQNYPPLASRTPKSPTFEKSRTFGLPLRAESTPALAEA
jgi:hypothetical protein